MLSENLQNIIYFLQSNKINAAEIAGKVPDLLDKAESINKLNFIIYDNDNEQFPYMNASAASFLGFDRSNLKKWNGALIGNIIHPLTFPMLQLDLRFHSESPGDFFGGAYYIRPLGKKEYCWIYATSKVVSFTPAGKPRLIYINFIEIEKAISYYCKILNGPAGKGFDGKILALAQSLKSREIEILNLICAEYTSKEMANALHTSQAAVDACRKRLMIKLGVRSVAGLVKAALLMGINNPALKPLTPPKMQLIAE